MPDIVKSTKKNAVSTEKNPLGTQAKSGDYTGGVAKQWRDYKPLAQISVPEPTHILYAPYTTKKDGSFYQKVEGWAITSNQIHVFVLLRNLQKLENKKMKPQGDWYLDEHVVKTIAGKPLVRTGNVKNSYAQTSASSGSSSSSSSKAQPSRTIPGGDSSRPSGYQSQIAVDIIPDAVKSPLLSMVFKDKAQIFGQSLGFTDSEDRIYEEQSLILVFTDNKAITVQATRKQSTKGLTQEQAREALHKYEWNVTQMTYQLTTDNTSISAPTKRKGISR